jgi:hypothetical protein
MSFSLKPIGLSHLMRFFHQQVLANRKIMSIITQYIYILDLNFIHEGLQSLSQPTAQASCLSWANEGMSFCLGFPTFLLAATPTAAALAGSR